MNCPGPFVRFFFSTNVLSAGARSKSKKLPNPQVLAETRQEPVVLKRKFSRYFLAIEIPQNFPVGWIEPVNMKINRPFLLRRVEGVRQTVGHRNAALLRAG